MHGIAWETKESDEELGISICGSDKLKESVLALINLRIDLAAVIN